MIYTHIIFHNVVSKLRGSQVPELLYPCWLRPPSHPYPRHVTIVQARQEVMHKARNEWGRVDT